MKPITAPVSMRQPENPNDPNSKKVEKKVAEATFFEYENLAEAADHVGEEKCLEYINAQVRANECNRVREIARHGPGKRALERQAMEIFGNLPPSEIAAIASGGQGAIGTWIEAKVAALEAEAKAKVGAGGSNDEE